MLSTPVVARSHELLATSNFGSPTGVTEQDKQVLHLWHITYYFAIPLGLLVIGLILWCIFRYRVRDDSTRQARQIQYHIPLEAAYTLIPLVIVVIVFGYMYSAENKVDRVAKNPALVVKVEGFQWGWRFTYPNGHEQVGTVANEPDISNDNELPVLYLPAHETVQLNLFSDDVNHSFYVPEFLFKRDLIQGVNNTVDFNIAKTGTFIGECTQLCGTYHAYMRFRVTVLQPGDFNQWLGNQAPGSITTAGLNS